MSSIHLTEEAAALIRAHIDSIGRLDLLLVLYDDPRVAWTADRMGRQMQASARWANRQMDALEQAGILRRENDAWAYDPADERTAAAVQALVTACRLDWPGVTHAVMSTRQGGAQAFSDAFRVRRRGG